MARQPVTSAEMRAAFPVGSKVAYSELGLDALRPRDPNRVGQVWGYALGGRTLTVCAVRVQWPGRKTSEVLHKMYLRASV